MALIRGEAIPFERLLVIGGHAEAEMIDEPDIVYALLLKANGGEALSLPAGALALTLYTLASLLWLDLGKYVGHFLTHRVGLLWEFHKVHHSAQVLTPVTVFRIHPLDFIFYDFISGLFIGTAGAVGLFVFGSQIEPLSIFGLNIGVFLFYALGANLAHSHVWLAYPGWASRILMSPAQHQIHHSCLPQHHDANFGVVFALWDWVFGTLYVPKGRETVSFGLTDSEDRDYQSIEGLLLRAAPESYVARLRLETARHCANRSSDQRSMRVRDSTADRRLECRVDRRWPAL